jgi:hypothetical protein
MDFKSRLRGRCDWTVIASNSRRLCTAPVPPKVMGALSPPVSPLHCVPQAVSFMDCKPTPNVQLGASRAHIPVRLWPLVGALVRQAYSEQCG